MATDSTSRTLLLLAGLALLGWALWLVQDVLPPFLIALVLALLLDPMLARMQRWGVPRWLAILLTFGAFLALFFGVIAVLVPRAIFQINDLLHNSESYGQRLQQAVDEWARANEEQLRKLRLPPTVTEFWEEYGGNVSASAQAVLQRMFGALQDWASKLGWLIVIPIVTLYLLMDMEALEARLSHLIPDRHRSLVGDLTFRVGNVFGAYLRGLSLICASYGLVVYLMLALVFRLEYAVILSLAAAVLYAVPYLGQLMLMMVACIVALITHHPGAYLIGLVVGLLVVGQLFDQLITPRVIGRQVGLHPVIGLFALMVGGQLFGLAGMLIAVPVAASLRVVLIQLYPRLTEPIPGFERRGRKRRDGLPPADPGGVSAPPAEPVSPGR